MLKSVLREGEDREIPMVWGKTEFHKDLWPVKSSYSEDEERAGAELRADHAAKKKPSERESSEGNDGITDLDKKAEKKKDSSGDNKKPEDPDRQGIIRKVDGAHLVYKKKNDSGTYDELWMFPYRNQFDKGTLKTGGAIKRAILAGTDIPVNGNVSPDGSQKCKIKVLGDAQFVFISGLPQ
jgi:hypothetical protein